jgi:hypothetical protein
MTTAIAIDGWLASFTDGGVSTEAKTLREKIDDVRDEMYETETLGKGHRDTIDALMESYLECCSDDWDGYGAKAVTEGDLATALRFLDALPSTIPPPEVSVDPDGEFAFDWYNGSNVLSISVGQLGRISYAAHFGKRRAHGTEYFSDELPAGITQNLARLFS